MNYDIFISDFDGTLVRADGTVTDVNKRAIAEYRSRGGIFAICTGRMLPSIQKRLAELGLTEGLVAAYHGAQIADIATGKLLKNSTFAEADICEILRFMESHDLRHQIYVGGDLIANRDSELLHIYEQICRVKATVADGSLADMVAANHLNVIKTLAICTTEELPEVTRLLTEKFGDRFYVATSSNYLVELMPKESSKAAAVEFLSAYYNVPVEKIASIGDHVADLPMLAACGGKFAVANAVEELKRIATVVPSVDDDGVAYALKHYAMQ